MSPDTVIKKHFWAVTLALVGVAAYFQASGITQIIGTALAVDDKGFVQGGPLPGKPPTTAAASTYQHTTSAKRIIERNPFDSVTGNLNPPPSASFLDFGPAPAATDDPYNVPDCGDGIKIVATAVSDDAAWSLAILSGGTGMAPGTHLRRQADDYAGKKLWFVRWDRVWLISPGQLCQIEMFPQAGKPVSSAKPGASAAPPGSAGGATAPTVPDDIKKGIVKVSATEYNVDRSVIDKVLENQAMLMRSARIVPEQENGKTVGIRLFGIKTDSLLGTIGMENGDRLEKINGFDMGSPEKALEAYARLRTADKLTVTINRKGQSMNLDYHIK